MKTKLIISILLGLSALSFVHYNSIRSNSREEQTAVFPPQNFQDTTFLIGALDDGFDFEYERLDELGFNVWHKYIGKNMGWTINGAPGDTLLADSSVYVPQVKAILDTNSSHGLKSIMMRPKVTFLYYGKRSDYQCEPVLSNDDLWFYSFNVSKQSTYIQNIVDTTYGNGAIVKRCKGDPADASSRADTIVKRLKANTEQSSTWADLPKGSSPIKNWIVKPRIRIDSTIADNPANFNVNVCKVIVIGETKTGADTILKSSNIKVINFINDQGNYDGKYIEEFHNFSSNDSLTINGLWGGVNGNRARGNHSNDNNNSKVDIQIYWYGICDMYIDYVRVDNMVAHRLLKPGGDLDFEKWLRWEAQDIACHNDSPIKFYIELFDFSNIPCMAYVSRKLDSLAYAKCQKHITLTGLISGIYSFVVPWEDRFSVLNTGHIIRNYVEKVGLSDILIPCYPFYTNKQVSIPYTNTTFAKIPNTLPSTNGGEVLANAISPSAYDDWLQDNLDHSPAYFETGSTSEYPWDGTARQWEGAFRWTMKMGDAISKAKDIPFLYNGQSHLWYYAEGESHKEPTNEEMEMIANVSLTYGERGLIDTKKMFALKQIE